MQDFLSETAAPDFLRVLQGVKQSGEAAHIRLDLGSLSHALGHDCNLFKTTDGHILLIADSGIESSDGLSELQAAAAELEQLKAQLRETKQALDIKHTELQAVVAQADEVGHTDSLTFLPNRRSIVADLQRQVTFAERYGSPLSVSMIDLDYFKDVNDNYGHGAGDQVLRFIASEMRDRIRQPDMIGRYGGDEFLVVLPNTPLAAAAEQAARLCQQVRANPFLTGKVEIKVSLSIGIAQYKQGADDWRSLLERADQALYKAKNAGRGQWAILEA
jgi:diguanylate cyclase (GGDEF)-like protein